ncbi:MAG: hypothetical protein GC129_03960 [Proteobacteria bacterium]|nr:hypothetical protein [Pseudomonadota bacterium]
MVTEWFVNHTLTEGLDSAPRFRPGSGQQSYSVIFARFSVNGTPCDLPVLAACQVPEPAPQPCLVLFRFDVKNLVKGRLFFWGAVYGVPGVSERQRVLGPLLGLVLTNPQGHGTPPPLTAPEYWWTPEEGVQPLFPEAGQPS